MTISLSPLQDEQEASSIHKLSPAEERLWERTKGERNTREDWEDLNATIVAYRRRRIARHLAVANQER